MAALFFSLNARIDNKDNYNELFFVFFEREIFMLDVLIKALSFVAIICIGYIFKRIGIFNDEDYRIVSKIVINLTLPAAVINSFADFKMDYSLLEVLVIGFLGNVVMVIIALMLTRRETAAAKLFYIFSMSGYNIGCFTLPFVQSFLGAFGVIVICIFDMGNAIMCTGLTYAFAASCIGSADGMKEPVSVRNVMNKLLTSVPFMVYFVMLALVELNIKLPDAFYTLSHSVGSANAFLSMLMIGMMFEIKMDKHSLFYIGEILGGRCIVGISLSMLFFFYGPFSPEINKVVAAALLAPSTAVGPIYLEKLGGNVQLAGFSNSASIIISVIALTVFFTITHV